MGWFLLYPPLSILLGAACANLACRLLGRARPGWLAALAYGLVAFLLVHGGFYFRPLHGVWSILLPFLSLLVCGWLFFMRWPGREADTRDAVRGLFLSLLAGGFYVVACVVAAFFLFWLDGWDLPGID